MPRSRSRRFPPPLLLLLLGALTAACAPAGPDKGETAAAPSAALSADAGWALLRRGDLAGAEPHLAATLARAPRDAKLLEALGMICARTDRPRRAEEHFRAALAVDSASTGARLGLAAVLIDTGRHDEALAEIETVRRRDPGHVGAILKGALLEVRRGRNREAEDAARRVIAALPDNAEAHYVVGAALDQRGDFAGAYEALRRAHELAPGHLGALGRLSALAARLGRTADAEGYRAAHVAALRRLRVEERVRGHRLKGVEAFNRADYPAALDAFSAIAREDPGDPQVHLFLGSTYLALGRHAEARRALERCLALDPDNDRGLVEMGRLHAVEGRLDEALAALRAAAAANPEFAEPHYYMAGVHRARGESDLAQAAERRYAELRARSGGATMEIVPDPGVNR